ncbi:hypothetical protein F53441_946 [Fusarium austroafricanum]|uniref:Uncharacterized protein n=1 Tax=Fusarium austroafricanum TaxID=2364996 RepID=A0A8H4KVN5_9HYPO|nr:hypothetical protein F53441_946 [Fusarium austroafricanum]
MPCVCPPPISSDLHKAFEAVLRLTKNNTTIQQSQVDQAKAIRQVVNPFNETVDDFEMLTMHLGDLSATKAYFYQVQENVNSIRGLSKELSNTLASINDADVKFGRDIRKHYTQFLEEIASYTGDDEPAFESLRIIAKKFHDLNTGQYERLMTMRDQLDCYMRAVSKIAALKHSLEEQSLI